jgi:hypothetical protein
MEFTIRARVDLVLSSYPGAKSSQHVRTDINLELSKELDEKIYFTEDKIPSAEGSKALTAALVQGLVANIHASHHYNYRDSAEHLRHIIAELERGFIEIGDVKKSNFNS